MAGRLLPVDPGTTIFRQLFRSFGSSCNHGLALWLNRTLDRSALDSALRLLLERQSVLSKAIEPGQNDAGFWYYWSERHLHHRLSVDWEQLDLPASEAKDQLARTAKQAVNTPIRIDDELPFRVVVRVLQNERTWLLFVVSHIATDGRGLMISLRDLLRYYVAIERGEDPAPSPAPLIPFDLHALFHQPVETDKSDNSQRSYLRRATRRPSNDAPSASRPLILDWLRRPQVPLDSYPFPLRGVNKPPSETDVVAVRYFRFDATATARLATVVGDNVRRPTDVVTLVFLYAFTDIAKTKGSYLPPLQVRIPVDLRPLCKDKAYKQAAGNLVSFVSVEIDPYQDLPGAVSDALRIFVRKKTEALMDWRNTMSRRLTMKATPKMMSENTLTALHRAVYGNVPRPPGFTASHLGKLDLYLGQLDELFIERFDPFPLIRDIEIYTLEFRGELTVVLAWLESAVVPAGIAELADRFDEYLHSLVD